MKKTVILAGLLACVALVFTSCNSGEEEKIKAQKTIDSLQAIVDKGGTGTAESASPAVEAAPATEGAAVAEGAAE